MRRVHTTYGVQQGSSSTLQVRNENAWYVYQEVWEGSRLLNTRLVAGPFATKKEALADGHIRLYEFGEEVDDVEA